MAYTRGLLLNWKCFANDVLYNCIRMDAACYGDGGSDSDYYNSAVWADRVNNGQKVSKADPHSIKNAWAFLIECGKSAFSAFIFIYKFKNDNR